MPVTIKSSLIKYKNASSGEYESIDAITQGTTDEMVAEITNTAQAKLSEINTAGTTNVTAVQNKGTEVLESIPSDYTNLNNEVSDLKSALDDSVFGVNRTFDNVMGNRSNAFYVNLLKGNKYTFTNNTSASCQLIGKKRDNTNDTIKNTVNAGDSYTFEAMNDYIAFGGWYNGSGNIGSVSILCVSTDIDTKIDRANNALEFTKELDKNDADYNLRVKPSEYVESADGSRIRVIYKIDKYANFTISCSEGKGVAISLYSTLQNAILANTSYIVTYTSNAYTTNEVSGNITQTGYLSVSLCKNDSTAITDAEWAELFEELSVSITLTNDDSFRLEKIEAEIDSIIGSVNDTSYLNADMNGKIVAASGYNTFVSGNWDATAQKKNNFSFAVITDVHGSKDAFSRFIQYVNDKKSYLDCCFGLGDFVKRQPSEGLSWLGSEAVKCEIPFLYEVGNHDTADTGLSGITEAQARERYFTDIVSKGWLSASNFIASGRCSWYKDFADYKIRIISVFEYQNSTTVSTDAPMSYCRRWLDSDTLQWFANTLYSTPTDYSVIVLLHQIPYAPMDKIQCSFTYDNAINWASLFLNTIDGNPVEEIVNAFKTSGSISKTYSSIPSFSLGKTATVSKNFSDRGANGKFIAYFTGHTHASYVLQSQTYPDQKCIVVPTGSENIFQRNYGDLLYDELNRNKDSFYVVGIDTNAKKIHLVKIGAQTTINMTERILYTVDY